MMRMNDNKTKRIIAGVLAVLLILAMVCLLYTSIKIPFSMLRYKSYKWLKNVTR